MHANTIRAIKTVADGLVIKTLTDDEVVLIEDAGDYGILNTYEVHRVAGGWIIAHWSNRNCQWQSSDVRGAEQSFCYAFARTLQGLADYGVTVYRSPSEALRSAMTV